MKIVWKRKRKKKKNATVETSPNPDPNLPFFERVKEEGSIGEDEKNGIGGEDPPPDSGDRDQEKKLAETLESEGVRLAESGLYNEALRKWEAAILLTPEKAKLHEQKAQVLLEIGDAWSSLKAAARATELDPLWAEEEFAKLRDSFLDQQILLDNIGTDLLTSKALQGGCAPHSAIDIGTHFAILYSSILRNLPPTFTQVANGKGMLHSLFENTQYLSCSGSCIKTMGGSRDNFQELNPVKAWITLGRAQLNYGEPDIAMESFDEALAIKPNHEEALIDRETASHLVKRRKQSHSTINSRYEIRDK